MLSRFTTIFMLLLPSIYGDAQKMPVGHFEYTKGDSVIRFVFPKNDSNVFYYASHSPGYGHWEMGIYSLIGNRLEISWGDSATLAQERTFSIKKVGEGKGNTTVLRVYFKDKTDYPAANVSIAGRGKLSNRIYGSQSNVDGVAELIIPNQDLPIKLATGYVGYRHREITIDSMGTYHIICPLRVWTDSPISENPKTVYIIKKHSRKKIVAREIAQAKFRTYHFTSKRLPPQVMVD